MSETLLQFQSPVIAPDGTAYEVRACGSEMPGGTWQGWLEFIPIGGKGDLLCSRRETTQPNRTDTVYWASGLTPVYLEGALLRALEAPRMAVPPPPRQPSIFPGPAPSVEPASDEPAATSVLDPFSVYEKGEALLRKQLTAFSAWHLVNIALRYDLTDEPVQALNRLPAAALIELIVKGVRERNRQPHDRLT